MGIYSYNPSRKKIGAVIRFFISENSEEAEKEKRINMLEEAVNRLLQHDVKIVNILIPAEASCQNRDRGDSFGVLKGIFGKRKKEVVIREAREDAGLYTGLLNRGIALQMSRGVTHSLVINPEAWQFINQANIGNIVEAAKAGSLISEIIFDEIKEQVEDGLLNNAFTLYCDEVIAAAGFFLRQLDGSMPPILGYPAVGGEAVCLAAHISKKYGRSISIIPSSGGKYDSASPQSYKEIAKWASKKERKIEALRFFGFEKNAVKMGFAPR